MHKNINTLTALIINHLIEIDWLIGCVHRAVSELRSILWQSLGSLHDAVKVWPCTWWCSKVNTDWSRLCEGIHSICQVSYVACFISFCGQVPV